MGVGGRAGGTARRHHWLPKHKVPLSLARQPAAKQARPSQASQASGQSLSAAFVLFWRQPISSLCRDCMQEEPRANLEMGRDYQC